MGLTPALTASTACCKDAETYSHGHSKAITPKESDLYRPAGKRGPALQITGHLNKMIYCIMLYLSTFGYVSAQHHQKNFSVEFTFTSIQRRSMSVRWRSMRSQSFSYYIWFCDFQTRLGIKRINEQR